jgi:hypothetical protein
MNPVRSSSASLSKPVVTRVPAGPLNPIEREADVLIRRRPTVSQRLFEVLTGTGQQTRAVRERVQSAIARSAADMVDAQAAADLEVAAAETQVRHDQMRSAMLLAHRSQNDLLNEQADGAFMAGITQLMEEKALALERLKSQIVDAELLKLTETAAHHIYETNLQHLFARHLQLRNASEQPG